MTSEQLKSAILKELRSELKKHPEILETNQRIVFHNSYPTFKGCSTPAKEISIYIFAKAQNVYDIFVLGTKNLMAYTSFIENAIKKNYFVSLHHELKSSYAKITVEF